MITIVAFMFVFSIMVFFHEFGHFIAAKSFGVKVFKFAFGMGPKIFGFIKNGTEYMICLVPVGGFVKMAGEFGQEDTDKTFEKVPDNQKFNKKSFSIRTFIVALGPIMNIFTSIIIFSLIFFTYGIPTTTNDVSTVTENGPADLSGILPGDKIIAINSKKMSDTSEISYTIDKNTEKMIKITVDRNGENIDIIVTPKYDENYQRGLIGVTFEISIKKINIFHAFGKGIITTGGIIKLIFSNTVEMITGKIPLEIAGPLGIAQMTGEAAKLGFLNLLYFTAILSIFIGLFNLLPIPILDGGQIIILAIEKIRGRPLEAEKINFIYLIGISFIIIVFLFATYKDILRLFVKK